MQYLLAILTVTFATSPLWCTTASAQSESDLLAYQNINSYFTSLKENTSINLLSDPWLSIEAALERSESPGSELNKDDVPVESVRGILRDLLSASGSCAQEWIDYLTIVAESTT